MATQVFDDNDPENLETVEVTLTNPSDPAVVIGTAKATANITDNDTVIVNPGGGGGAGGAGAGGK